MRKSNFTHPMIAVLVALLSFPAIVCAQDSTQVQTQLETTYYRPVPVQVTNTPLPTKVISEPTTTRNVNVVSEPATPRDVNVLNAVNVSANQPLPVSVQPGAINPADYFSTTVAIHPSPPVIITTVPQGKLLLVTDLIVPRSVGYTIYFGSTTSLDTITDVRLRFSAISTLQLSLQTPIVFSAGQQVAVFSEVELGSPQNDFSVIGKFVDA